MAGDVLLAYASSREGERVASRFPELVCALGTGKARAAASMALAIERRRPRCVLLFGVCGAYPAGHGVVGTVLAVGDLCVVGEDVLGDEGVATENGFLSLAALELGNVGPFSSDRELTRKAALVLDVPIVRGATVSTCSANDKLSCRLVGRTAAAVETMEGAAVGLVCTELAVPWVQVRCVSNMTGDRAVAAWDLDRAVTLVQDAVIGLLEVGWSP